MSSQDGCWWASDPCVSAAPLPVPEQRVILGRACPLVLCWRVREEISRDEQRIRLAAWLARNQVHIERSLSEHGAILFRGFPVGSAEDFDEFVGSFSSWKDLPYGESLSFAVRTHVVGRVCTTNDGKNGGMVFHHEQAQTPKWPSKLLFFCLQPAEQGGGTGISSSALVYSELQREYPAFVSKCTALGVKYSAYLAAEPDPTKGVGRGWKSFWGSATKAGAEERMRHFNYTWEWLPSPAEGGEEILRCTTPVLACVRSSPLSNVPVFFNQLVAQLTNAREWASRAAQETDDLDLSRFLSFGDDSPIDQEPLEFARKVADDSAIELNWQQGDIGLLDNYLVMHARRPFEGDRKVLASLVE